MDSGLVAILTGSGVAGVFCVLFILGLVSPRSVVADKDSTIAELKGLAESERDRAETAVAALIASKDVIAALQEGLRLGAAQRLAQYAPPWGGSRGQDEPGPPPALPGG